MRVARSRKIRRSLTAALTKSRFGMIISQFFVFFSLSSSSHRQSSGSDHNTLLYSINDSILNFKLRAVATRDQNNNSNVHDVIIKQTNKQPNNQTLQTTAALPNENNDVPSTIYPTCQFGTGIVPCFVVVNDDIGIPRPSRKHLCGNEFCSKRIILVVPQHGPF